MPFLSVIITVYNKADYIKDTLNSVLNQTFKDFEVLIVNDGSTDNSVQIIDTFNDERIKVISTKNNGASTARNTGIKNASCDFIALLDGDDLWDLDYLNSVHKAILTFTDIKVFTTAISQKYNNRTIPVTYSFSQNEDYGIHNYFEASQKYPLITSSSIVFEKSVLDKTGTFDTSIISGQDTDLWIRFGLHYPIVFINKQLVIYNYNPLSLSNTSFELSKKPKFNKYFNEEKDNTYLKLYLDRNRYSMALLSKLQNDTENFKYYTSHLNPKHMSLRQNLLLKSPKWLLKLMLGLKSLGGEKVYYS